MNELEVARNIINEVDSEMARLFEKRMKAVELVAKYKKEHGLSILDTSRENDVVKKNSALIDDDTIKEYYVEFLNNNMEISRAYQSRLNEGMRVAYSGATGAYAHIASKKMYSNAIYVPYKDFESAYQAVENGECDACVLPIENSYAGDVAGVMDLAFFGNLYVTQAIDLEIDHCLIGLVGATKDDIKTVVSHPQALSQCVDYINKNGYSEISYPNTALASKYVKETNDKSIGAIASRETAEIFGLNILESKINTSRSNTTRFLSFSRAMNLNTSEKKKMNEHFILVFTVRNEAGALAKTIDIIGAHRYNMRNLRSRPMKELLWNYYFFVEADGNINTQNGKDMLRELSATCDRLKLVGTYYS